MADPTASRHYRQGIEMAIKNADKNNSHSSRPTFTDQEALLFHSQGRPGKLEVVATKPMATQRDLSLAYSPGVAVPVLAIAEDEEKAFDYTTKGNFVGDHQWYRHSRSGQSWRAGGETGDGRQSGAVQALRRYR